MNLLTVRDKDTDAIKGAFIILNEQEHDDMGRQRAHLIEMPDDCWVILACAQDGPELDMAMESGSARDIYDHLDRGRALTEEEPEWPPKPLAMRREDYERMPVIFNDLPASVNVVLADEIRVAVQGDEDKCVAVCLHLPTVKTEVSYELTSKEIADKFISAMVSARNRRWPSR